MAHPYPLIHAASLGFASNCVFVRLHFAFLLLPGWPDGEKDGGGMYVHRTGRHLLPPTRQARPLGCFSEAAVSGKTGMVGAKEYLAQVLDLRREGG